jgi:hypothetical protein
MIQVPFLQVCSVTMLRIPGLALLVQQQQKRATALTPKTSAPIISLVHCGQSGTITPY